MIAADRPVQRPADAKLLIVNPSGDLHQAPRAMFVEWLRPGDLVVANDAATLPASLHGVHLPSGAPVEVRLAGHVLRDGRARGWADDDGAWCPLTLAATAARAFLAVVFGAGDFRTRTENRPLPPPLARGDRLVLGPLTATVGAVLGHPRFVRLEFGNSPVQIRAGFARHGRPIQYAHVPVPLALWDVWTPVAGLPVAFEPPSASFAVDWRAIRAMRARGVEFQTLTLAAGISSTGDPALDARLPLDEPYRIPGVAADAIQTTKDRGGRVLAVGTTVVRALEHAAARDGVVRAGEGVADQRIGPGTRLRAVDVLLSGTHEPGTSHYEILRAFLNDETLAAVDAVLEARGYRTHEFGDSVLIERSREEPGRPRAVSRSERHRDAGVAA